MANEQDQEMDVETIDACLDTVARHARKQHGSKQQRDDDVVLVLEFFDQQSLAACAADPDHPLKFQYWTMEKLNHLIAHPVFAGIRKNIEDRPRAGHFSALSVYHLPDNRSQATVKFNVQHQCECDCQVQLRDY